jgi:uncharacterized protein
MADVPPAQPAIFRSGLARSKLGEPFQKLTRRAIAPVRPGEVTEYKIHILATANQFKAGRRLCIEIT